MRLLWLAAAAILIAGPARADVTARYATGFAPNTMPPMIIEVNDRGDSRIAMGNSMAVLTLDGITYVVTADLNGTFVARQDDLLAIQVEHARSMLDSLHSERQHGTVPAQVPPAGPRFQAVQGGHETVAGRTGTIWSLRTSSNHASPADLDFVVSSDADLAPVGRALARQFASSRSALRQMTSHGFGADDSGFFDGTVAIFERGAVIRWSRLARLESVDSHPIPASDFVLPSAPLSRAQLETRMGLGQPQRPPAAASH